MILIVEDSNAAPQIVVSDVELDFGEVPVNVVGELTLHYTNIGDSDLIVYSSEVNEAAFFLGYLGNFVLSPFAVFDMTVQFIPNEIGEFEGIITTISNDPYIGELHIQVTGIGVIDNGNESPVINLQPIFLDFGETAIGESKELTVNISNDGGIDLTVNDISVESDQFSVQFNGVFILPPSGDYNASVTFEPEDEGIFQDSLLIFSDDPDNPTVMVELVGTGIWPPPEDIIDLIEDWLDDLVDEGVINNGQGNALTSKLESALAKLENGQVNVAVSMLLAFINQVNALMNGNNPTLTQEEGQALIDATNAAIDQLNGVNSDNPVIELINPAPRDFYLSQAYPNPFNSTTTITYGLPEAGQISICIYEINGRMVETLIQGFKQGGVHRINWGGNSNNHYSQASGIYYITMESDDFKAVRKVVMLK